MCYNEPEDLNNDTEATAILNQLLEMPAIWDAVNSYQNFIPSVTPGFEQGVDGNSMFANMDMNLDQNFGVYGQDFSQYNDVQFNMLVNEIQTPPTEAQESASSMVHVKTEEELWGRDSQEQSALTRPLCPLEKSS